MPANNKATIDFLAAVNALQIRYLANQATVAVLAGLAAGATDPQIQALNTAMPTTAADLSALLKGFIDAEQVR